MPADRPHTSNEDLHRAIERLHAALGIMAQFMDRSAESLRGTWRQPEDPAREDASAISEIREQIRELKQRTCALESIAVKTAAPNLWSKSARWTRDERAGGDRDYSKLKITTIDSDNHGNPQFSVSYGAFASGPLNQQESLWLLAQFVRGCQADELPFMELVGEPA